ncbi:MAG: helix-turn-helix domain-containing protein [Ignavibacteriae bacterium]|nr:helix-turn-helix domain-containing protein [Ignavibacteriota bacterium]
MLDTYTQIQPETNIIKYNLRLYSINEVREILKIRHATVKMLIEDGKIEVITIGKRIKIPAVSLYKYIEENAKKISQEEKEQYLSNSRDYVNNKIDSIIKTNIRRN